MCKKGVLLLAAVLIATAALVAFASPPEQGEAKSVRFSKKMLFLNRYEEAAVADFNKDGILDIVSGSYWFPGPDFVPRAFRPNESATNFVRSNSDLPYDVDGDGWTDIVVGAWGEEGVLWFKNPGVVKPQSIEPWEMFQLTPTKGKIERTDFHDYDGDGVPEIQTVSYVKTEPVEIYRLTKAADGKPAAKKFVLGTEGGGHGYAWGDVNNDGREDLLTEVGWYERPAGDPFAKPWKFRSETALPHPSCPFVVKDINGDGRLDIFFGRGHDYGVYWWEQGAPKPDGGTTWTKHVIDESWSQGHVAALADVDGDGEDEFITGKCVYAHNGRDPGAEEPAVLYYLQVEQGSLEVRPAHHRGSRRRRRARPADCVRGPQQRRQDRYRGAGPHGAVGADERRVLESCRRAEFLTQFVAWETCGGVGCGGTACCWAVQINRKATVPLLILRPESGPKSRIQRVDPSLGVHGDAVLLTRASVKFDSRGAA